MSSIQLPNPHLDGGEDFLYHFGLSTNDDLAERFGDVKFLCMGGKPSRMKNFANFVYEKLDEPENSEFEPEEDEPVLLDISAAAGRYALYKIGPVLSASHGIGSASMSVALHELLKLLHYAGCTDVTVIRIGTSGGLGVEPGTVVISNQAYNSMLEPQYRQIACGKEKFYNSKTCKDLAKELHAIAEDLEIESKIGNTMSADDFYEEQGRLDGALCCFTEDDKIDFLRRAFVECEIVNIEMESACWVAMCNRADVKSAVVCVTLVNRLESDQVTDDRDLLKQWETFPQAVVAEFIKRRLEME